MKNSKRGTKGNTYRTKDIIKILKEENPECRDDMYNLEEKYDLEFQFLDEGSFREVFEILGYDLILKIPTIDEDDGCGVENGILHSENEVRAIKKIKKQKKYEALKPYIPKILWYNDKGVILMPKYKFVVRDTKKLNVIRNLFKSIFGREFDGSGTANWGKKDSTFILLDLGILGMTKKQLKEEVWGWNEEGASWY